MKNKYLLISIAFLFFSCNHREPKNLHDEFNLSQLGMFSKITDEMTGCGCTFYLDEKLQKNQKFFYTDVGYLAFIIYKGKVEKLDFVKNKSEIKTFRNNKFEIKRIIKKSKSTGDETTEVSGELTITRLSDKQSIKIQFIGDCGC